jgi:UDP-glucose 4-epimerase
MILVTGGAGFIGSHLTEALVDRGESVIVLDNLSTGSVDNLAPLEGRAGWELVEGSVTDRALVDELVGRCDRVVHLAAAVGVQLVLQRPLDSFLVNIDGTHCVLEAARRTDARVVIASTSEVYGKNSDVPLREDSDRVLGPLAVTRWWYSISKGVDEILALGYHDERGADVVVARFFNTVGPRQVGRYGMVIPRLVAQALAGEDLTVYGDGEQTRTFCHVADTVAAVLGLLDAREVSGSAFNIGGTLEVTINQLATRIIDVVGGGSAIVHQPYDEVYPKGFEDTARRVPDTSALQGATGWQPTRSLDDILCDVRDSLAT